MRIPRAPWRPLYLVVITMTTIFLQQVPSSQSHQPCPPDRLTVYRVIMNAYWSKKVFPKHFPTHRPPAQFSKLIGRSHDQTFSLFGINKTVTPGFKTFVETGSSDLLLDQMSRQQGLYDEIIGAPITTSVGTARTEFFVDGNHSRVSLVSRIVPSPDWFVGISDYNLCEDGRWVDSVMIEVDPLDAGTDNGLTFTSPNWPSEPQGSVQHLTPRNPNHPASSFYYQDRDTLPPIAAFHFLKVKEYALSEIFRHQGEEDSFSKEPKKKKETNFKSGLPPSSLSPDVEEEEESNNVIEYLPYPQKSRIIRNKDKSKRRLKKFRPPRDCLVSDWSPWTPCSKDCGLGEMTRDRHILSHPRRGGNPCPPLKQAKWCGSARNCARNYFNWAGRW